MNHTLFLGNMKMADLILANGRLMYILPYFGFGIGFGEKSIEEVCTEYGVPLPLFLLVCNHYTFDNYTPNIAEMIQVSIESVVWYLHSAHTYYLDTRMPKVIDSIISLANLYLQPETKNILIDFCDQYKQGVIAHIKYEEEEVFPHIRKLLAGEKADNKIDRFEDKQRNNIAMTLKDLRNIIIKFTPRTCSVQQCTPVLYEIAMLEYDLQKHSRLESTILPPLMELLAEGNSSYNTVELSERERETLAALARGLSNKEIAEKLHISMHTVVSHRKNIIRKTGIKTAQGLALYAFIKNLISHQDIR